MFFNVATGVLHCDSEQGPRLFTIHGNAFNTGMKGIIWKLIDIKLWGKKIARERGQMFSNVSCFDKARRGKSARARGISEQKDVMEAESIIIV